MTLHDFIAGFMGASPIEIIASVYVLYRTTLFRCRLAHYIYWLTVLWLVELDEQQQKRQEYERIA